MSLSDFSTLAEAQAHEVTTYSKVTAGQSSQYFGLSGMLDSLEANSSDVTPLVISETMTTTVGALCRTVLNSAKTTGFASDPSETDGANNRGAAQLLLAAGVFPAQSIVDGFWAIAETKTKPFATATQADFDAAKNPPQLTQCTYHADSEFVVSISGKDLFSFVTTTTGETPTTNLTMYWREDGTAQWKKYQSPFILQGGNGVLSQVLRRPSGINAARHFKFEYTPKYEGLITSIAVTVGQ